MLLHGCALGERSSSGIWKFRTSSFKCYVDHSHTMHSSGNIDVQNWVHLFESPCICRHTATAHFSHLTNKVLTACFNYHLHWSSLWVEISTLPYETNSSCWQEWLSVAYCTHIIQTKLMLKNQISTKIDVYSYSRAHTHASFSAGVIYRGCGVETCNTQPSI